MGDVPRGKPIIEIPFEYTLAERELIRNRFLNRKAALGVGNPTLSFTMCKTVSARRLDVLFPDGMALPNPSSLTARDLSNFEGGRMTRHEKLVIIDAYLKIVDEAPPTVEDDMAA